MKVIIRRNPNAFINQPTFFSTEEQIVGPVNTGIPNSAIIKPMSTPYSNTNLTEKITLGPDYYEQYWYNMNGKTIYSLMISPRYENTTKTQVSYTNNGQTYECPNLFIPLKEKHLYSPLWNKAENEKYVISPTDSYNNKVTGFVATKI